MKKLVLLILSITIFSCSNNKHTINKTRQKAERMTSFRPQYAFINNQIVIFENKF
jgi:hypothetical protein